MSLTLKGKNTARTSRQNANQQTPTEQPTKLQALQRGVAKWLEQNNTISVGFMQHTSPGAAIVAPIQSLTTPMQQVFVRDESAMVQQPEQHVTGIVSVLAGADQPRLRIWSKVVDTTSISPQWHRLTQSETRDAGIFERLGMSSALSAILRLSGNQTSLIPFNPIQFEKNKAIEKFSLEWQTSRAIESPIELALAIVPYASRETTPTSPDALMATATRQGKTIKWRIRPRRTRGKLQSPNLLPLLPKSFLQKPATQQLALLIHVNAIDDPVTVKSTTQEDGTADPLKLTLVSRRFTLKQQPVVKFWFDYLPALQSSAPHTAFIRARAWRFSQASQAKKTTGFDQFPQAQLYLEKPTPQGPARPYPLTDQPYHPVIDLFSSPQAWRPEDQLGPLLEEAASKNRRETPTTSFRTGDLSWLLSGLTFSDAPDLRPEDHHYRHYDPVAFYLPLPESFTQNDIQNLSDRIHGTPAILSLLNNADSYSGAGSSYTDNFDTIALFQYHLARMHQFSEQKQKAAALYFTPLAITPKKSKNNKKSSDTKAGEKSATRHTEKEKDKEQSMRVWVQIPLTRQTAAHKRALANAPIGIFLSVTPHMDVQGDLQAPAPITQTLWTWRSFNAQQQETVNMDISSLVSHLRASPEWQAGHGLRIAARPVRNLHYPLLAWTEAKLVVQSPTSAFNQRVTFSARSQLLQTLEMLQPLMRGSVSDALLEASLFYTEQPPFFGQARQRFPGTAKRPAARFSRISHPSTITEGQIIQPAGCSKLAPDSPQCAKEYYAGRPRYQHSTAHCHAQHLILISDGNPPVNHSQSVAAALMKQPFCHRDSLAASEQCGRSIARWLSSKAKAKRGNHIAKPKVYVHTLAFGTRDEPTQRYLYDIAAQGQGLYGNAKNASDITAFLNEVVALSDTQAPDLPACNTP